MSLRVVIVTHDEPFYLPEFFDAFFREIPDGIDIYSVTILGLLNSSIRELISRMYGLYGPRNFCILGLKFAYRKLASITGESYSVESIAQGHNVTVTHRESVNEPDFISYLRAKDVDVVLSVAAPEILDTEVLNAPKWGCVNVHTASLPEYRGILPTFWALYHGESEIGITVHTMDEEIDKGQIIRQTSFRVADDDSLHDVIRRGKHLGGKVTAKALSDIVTGEISLKKMRGKGFYYSFPTAEDRREFQRRGRNLL